MRCLNQLQAAIDSQKHGPDMLHKLGALADGVLPEGVFWPLLARITSGSTPLDKLKKASDSLRRLLGARIKDRAEPAPGHQMLVVDDEQSIAFSMSDYFSQKGFKVDTAYEVEEAESLIESNDYQAIILDLRLGFAAKPRGLDVIRFVHEHKPNTRIVVLTACSSPEIETEALSSGADVFLRKPKPLSQLAQVVQGLIESPRKRAARQT